VTPAMIAYAESLHPDDACFVPEKREELTTEGGLDVVAHKMKVKDGVKRLQDRGIHVSLFVDPEANQIESAKEAGAHAVEIHTGTYCNASLASRDKERENIAKAATLARSLGLEVHGGHRLNYENVLPIASVPEIVELNIGHSIIARAVIVGIEGAVREMKELLNRARDW
jgi:pyridoxine 5-phosphate synthase